MQDRVQTNQRLGVLNWMMDQNFKLFINSANSGYMLCVRGKAEEASRTRVR